MQTNNDTPASTAMTLLFSALALVALFGVAGFVPDALPAAIR